MAETTPLLTAEQAAEVMLLAYAYRHGATSDALEAHLRSLTAPAPVQPAVKEALTTPFDPEALIRAVLPGGHSCDPQAVADDIREWVEAWAKLKIDAELEDGSKVTIEVSGEYRECKRLEAYLANLWRQIEAKEQKE